ncbi:MAG TPA: class I SAM-dependent methyltransferase [bacterium]|nr:class I SAM-dependent methyltransferase [bacterium]
MGTEAGTDAEHCLGLGVGAHMFSKSAELYDAVYAAKDYAREAQRLHALIEHHKRSGGARLLDVACGTGNHLTFLKRTYAVEGLDLHDAMLAIARRKHPDVAFHRADMVEFDLGREFDVVVCLFSSIGYVGTDPRLRQALRTMRRHTRPGGVVIVEPWLGPDTYRPGHVAAVYVDQPDLKVARMNVARADGGKAVLDFHYLVATPRGIEYFTERHDLALFPHEAYLEAFRACGLDVVYDPEGLIGRGLYIGTRPLKD